MAPSQESTKDSSPGTKWSNGNLRGACSACRQSKKRCSGGEPCTVCLETGRQCVYTDPGRPGRPKGSKNKRTVDRIRAQKHSGSRTEDNREQPNAGGPAVHDQTGNNGYLNMYQNLQSPSHLPPHNQSPSSGMDLNEPIATRRYSQDASNTTMDVMSNVASFEPLDLVDTNPLPYDPGEEDQQRYQLGDVVWSQIMCDSNLEESSWPDIGDTDMLDPAMNNTSLSATTSNATNTALPAPPATCECFARHISLLHHLDDLAQERIPSPLERTLSTARRANETWYSLMQCPSCQQDRGDSVHLLLRMSLRLMLRCLKRSLLFESEATQDSQDLKPLKRRVLVGSFDATGGDRAVILKAIVLLAVRRAELMFTYLQWKLESTSPSGSSVAPEFDRLTYFRTYKELATKGHSVLSDEGPGAQIDALLQKLELVTKHT